MVYDALEMSYRKVKVRKDPECAGLRQEPDGHRAHRLRGVLRRGLRGGRSRRRPARRSSARELKDLLDDGDNIFLVDVREPDEYEIVSIPGATLIPKDEFLPGAALERLPQDKQIVLHCKTRRALGRDASRW